jgi:hypothetical protein
MYLEDQRKRFSFHTQSSRKRDFSPKTHTRLSWDEPMQGPIVTFLRQE